MSCYKVSNNRFFNSPAISDGREFTDYRPNCEMNNHVIDENKISNIHDYRLYLINNAEDIIEAHNKYYFSKNGRVSCKQPYEKGTMLPERTRVLCDQHTCRRILVDENGIGEGREYVTNGKKSILDPLKKPDYKLDDNVCTTLEDNFNYYPFENVHNDNSVRRAGPGGGKILGGGDPNVFETLG
jgi:hypothetical protein